MRSLPRIQRQAFLLWSAHVSRCAPAVGETSPQRRGGRERRPTRRNVLEGGKRNPADGHAGLQRRPLHDADVASQPAACERRQAAATGCARYSAWQGCAGRGCPCGKELISDWRLMSVLDGLKKGLSFVLMSMGVSAPAKKPLPKPATKPGAKPGSEA